MATPASGMAGELARPARLQSIDLLRGLVMVFMALDHVRDFFTHLRFAPENMSQTYAGLFLTRFVTHYSAPTFFLLAGTGAYLYGRTRTKAEVSNFLWTRGLFLVVMEFTVSRTNGARKYCCSQASSRVASSALPTPVVCSGPRPPMRLRVGIDWRPVRRPTYSALVVSGVAPSSTARCTFSPVAS